MLYAGRAERKRHKNILVFDGYTGLIVGFVVRWLNYCIPSENGSNLKGFASVVGKSFPFRVDPFSEGAW